MLLVYANGSLPAREPQAYKLPFDIQALPFEINLRKEKFIDIQTTITEESTLSEYFQAVRLLIRIFKTYIWETSM